jgi:ATP-dependent exoDNAse (exonuclease V) beta subunit
LVKTFSFDLKLPGNFNVEMDTTSFHNKVIALLLNKIGEDAYVSQLLKEFAKHNAENNHAWDPEQQLQEFTNLLLQEDASGFIARLNQFSREALDAFRQQFLDFIKTYEAQQKEMGRKALDLIAAQGLQQSDFAHGKGGPVNFFQKSARAQAGIDDILGSRLVAAVDSNCWFTKKSPLATSPVNAVLTQIARSLMQYIESHHQAYLLCKLLAKQMYALLLLKKIEEISRDLKEEEHVVFLSEFNHKISDIITNEPTPFIYERLGEKYNHYLIDEFQDTSSLQWHNLIPLIDNSLAGGHRNLVVGDGKQSIYRWRNANVMQFAALPQLLQQSKNPVWGQYQKSLEQNYAVKHLDTNRRSGEQIVAFNNAFFDFTAAKVLSDDFKSIYNGQAQHSKPTETHQVPGFVRIVSLADKDTDKENFYLEHLLAHIAEAKQKGYRYEDMCVLVRKNYQGSLVAERLANERIPVVSSDSLLLKNNREVNTLVAYLSYRSDANDHVSAAAILYYFHQQQRLSANAYHACLFALSKQEALSDILKAHGIPFNHNTLALHNVFDTCLEAIHVLQLQLNASAYLRFFLDEVSVFLQQQNASVSKFLEWWEKRREKASLIVPKGSEAIQVMSIHASKGLEFPLVFLPFCDWSLNQSTDKWVQVSSEQTSLPVAVIHLSQSAAKAGFEKEVTRENQEQLLDNLNLLYVAFTRAVDKLFVYTAVPKTTLGNVYNWISDYLLSQGHHTGGCAEFGENSDRPILTGERKEQDYVLEALQFNPRQDAVKIKSSYLGKKTLNEAGARGLLLHHLLSGISWHGDIKPQLQKALQSGLLASSDINTLAEQLTGIIQDPRLSPYFQAEVKQHREREIITADGDILRPDKVVFNPHQTVVIDYKTGKKHEKDHSRQITRYAEVLVQMGYPTVKKILVYLDTREIVEVN